MSDDERTWMIEKLKRHKSSLEESETSLKEELSRYQDTSDQNSDFGEFKDLEYDIFNNPSETYLLAQIKIIKALPPILDEHIDCIEEVSDLDMVLDSLEFEIYKVKKRVYVNIREWEALLNHLSDHRMFKIQNNPKGPGDQILKELCWIRDYENIQRIKFME
jgi:bacterioferritin